MRSGVGSKIRIFLEDVAMEKRWWRTQSQEDRLHFFVFFKDS